MNDDDRHVLVVDAIGLIVQVLGYVEDEMELPGMDKLKAISSRLDADLEVPREDQVPSYAAWRTYGDGFGMSCCWRSVEECRKWIKGWDDWKPVADWTITNLTDGTEVARMSRPS